jgi:hypothetical protein
MNTLISIRNVLLKSEHYDGWLYLPDEPWTLDTNGIFVQSDKDAAPGSTEHIPQFVKTANWKGILDSDSIEDIIENATIQLINPTLEELLQAFIFYVHNDAFFEF